MLRSIGTRISGGFSSGGRRLKEYGISLFNDYRSVVKDTIGEVRTSPWKGVASVSIIGGVIYLIKTNPDREHFLADSLRNQSSLSTIGDPVRNPRAEQRSLDILDMFNQNRLARLNCILFSIVWRRDYDESCDTYATQCKVLRANWRDFYARIVDVGVADRWVINRRSMRDYDVNPQENLSIYRF